MLEEGAGGLSYREVNVRVAELAEDEWQVFIDGPDDAHGEAVVSLSVGPERVQELLGEMESSARSPGQHRQGPLDAARAFGEELMANVISGKVRDVYRQARDRETQDGCGLRIALYLPSDLMDIPWEFLCEEGRFLSHSVKTPVVRCLNLGSATSPHKLTPPLTVLGIVSNPRGVGRLDAEAERQRLEDALAPLIAAGDVQVHWLERATLSELERAVARPGEVHVIHYIGHGEFADGRGALLLEDDAGEIDCVSGEDLATMLQDEPSLRLVVLNACEGARTSEHDPFSSVAASLLRFEVPAVIGMQFAISDAAAIAFAGRLYEALADRFPIDAALAQSRRSMVAGRHGAEFGTPVLFLASGETQLFDITATDGRERKCDISLDLRRLPSEGQAWRWELLVENIGAAELRSVMASDAGRQLAEPFELLQGRHKVLRWSAAIEAPPQVTVTASDRHGSGVSEEIAAAPGLAEPELPSAPIVVEEADVVEEAEDADVDLDEGRRRLGSAPWEFEDGAASSQIETLRDAVGSEDSPIALCRCARGQDAKRHVLLLLTTRQLVWAREGSQYSLHWGRMWWRDVVEVEPVGEGGVTSGRGFRALTGDGRQLTFDSFDGIGLDFGEREIDFSAGSICALARDLAAQAGGLGGLPEGIEPQSSASDPDLRLQANRDRVLEMSGDFENGLYRAQQQALLDALNGEEELLRMVRCAEEAQFFRSTALILTSARAIAVRESVTSSPSVKVIDWDEVVSVEGERRLLRLLLRNGNTVQFSQISNHGIVLGPGAEVPAGKSIADFVRTLVDVGNEDGRLEERAEQNRQQLSEMFVEFENGIWGRQKNLLLEALNASEELIAMCRCAREGAIFRAVALLFTSERLLACRESAFSSGEIQILAWSDIRAVNTRDTVLDFVGADGKRTSFGRFNGKGVTRESREVEFSPRALRELSLELIDTVKPTA